MGFTGDSGINVRVVRNRRDGSCKYGQTNDVHAHVTFGYCTCVQSCVHVRSECIEQRSCVMSDERAQVLYRSTSLVPRLVPRGILVAEPSSGA